MDTTNTKKVTAAQVKQATLAKGISKVYCRSCGFCNSSLYYNIIGDRLFFSPGCGCSWTPMEERSWQDAADWINMQTNEEIRKEIMEKFGIKEALEENKE